MNKRTFGKTGLEVSPLGFGGAPVGFLETDRERVGNILNVLLDAGMNVIDTAASYAASEEVIGATVGHRRQEYVLISKCGAYGATEDAPAWSAALIARTVDQSLRRLQTDVIDVMLLHTCGLPTLQAGEALGALVAAREAGKIRFAGYSGDNEVAAFAATLADIDVIETSVNICDQANIPLVLPAAQNRDLGVVAKRPIANAAWKNIKEQPGSYQEYAREYTERLQKMEITPHDLGYDGSPEEVWPDLALRFTLSQPGVHTAIIGTTDPDHARRNIAAADKGPLPVEVVQKIRSAFINADKESDWRALG